MVPQGPLTTPLEGAVREYFDRMVEMRPIFGSYFGLHEYDSRLPVGGKATTEGHLRLVRDLSSRLDSLEGDPLERELTRYFTDLTLFELDEQRTWTQLVEGPELLGSAVFLLFARENQPLEQRLEAIAGRLEQAPGYLVETRELLVDPVELWCEVGLETIEHLPALLHSVVAAAPEGTLKARLEHASAAAEAALEDHARWLREDALPRSRPDFALGRERFDRLVQLRRLPDGADAILEMGRRHLAEVTRMRDELITEHWPGRSLTEVEAEVKADHPATFAAALDEYRHAIADSRRFVQQRGLATLPPDEDLVVTETPGFLRPVIPFAAYEPAAHFDQRQQGIYLVTPPADGTELADRNRADILNTSVHEGYPGHHLQFACASRQPSLARLLAGLHATEFVEGWAHYCEQLMYEEGFSHSPAIRFVQLSDLIWRACRIIIDVQLSRGDMSFDAAVDMLVQRAAMAPPNAIAEVKRYTYTPGYQLSYLYGKDLLLGLRERERSRLGSSFDLREFHDRLLAAGALPAAFWPRLFA